MSLLSCQSLVVAVVCMATILTGCGEKAEQVTQEQAREAITGGDVYTPSGIKLTQAVTAGEQVSLAYTVGGKRSEIFAAIRKQMTGRGWKETTAIESANEESMLAYEKDTRVVMYSLDADQESGVVVMQNSFGKEAGESQP